MTEKKKPPIEVVDPKPSEKLGRCQGKGTHLLQVKLLLRFRALPTYFDPKVTIDDGEFYCRECTIEGKRQPELLEALCCVDIRGQKRELPAELEQGEHTVHLYVEAERYVRPDKWAEFYQQDGTSISYSIDLSPGCPSVPSQEGQVEHAGLDSGPIKPFCRGEERLGNAETSWQ